MTLGCIRLSPTTARPSPRWSIHGRAQTASSYPVRDFASTCPEENRFFRRAGWNRKHDLAFGGETLPICRPRFANENRSIRLRPVAPSAAPDLAHLDLPGRGPLLFKPFFDDGHYVFMLWQMMRGKHKMTLILSSQVFKQRDLGCLVGEDGIV